MTKELLDITNIYIPLKKKRCKGVAKHMRRDSSVDTRLAGSLRDQISHGVAANPLPKAVEKERAVCVAISVGLAEK